MYPAPAICGAMPPMNAANSPAATATLAANERSAKQAAIMAAAATRMANR